MQIFLLTVFLLLYMNDHSNLYGFNLDYTDHLLNNLDRDCLYYNAHRKEDTVFQIIEYCIRFQVNTSVAYNENYHSRFTFDELQQVNVTSRQLYTWLAPVDVIEHYQSYLENKTSSSSGFRFYNCTHPWFGSRCEYAFAQPESDFTQQVVISFQMKRSLFWGMEISCYMHIQCDRGQTPNACLDWREVCDGKVDCLDGGYDEEHCWQLEINECDNETEFRCHIGQCIPLEFLNDDSDSADCLDQSDEGFTGIIIFGNEEDEEENEDLVKPIFRFEESMCVSLLPKQYAIECGYLVCISIYEGACPNKKNLALQQALFKGVNLSTDCYKAIGCLIDMTFSSNDFPGICSVKSLYQHPETVKQHCPPLIKLSPIMFGHVSFVYKNNRHWNVNMTEFSALINPPDYICYNAKLCDHNILSNPLRPPIDLFGDNSTCRSFDELEISVIGMQYRYNVVNDLYALFRTCSTYHQPPSISNYSNLYACANSSKIISKHRLVDRIKDCWNGDDESYTESCSLSIPNHRFTCAVKNRTVCLARVRVNETTPDCDDGSDERHTYLSQLKEAMAKSISFATLCDGFIELPSILIDERNETDETECNYFPCNNTYTRCDGFWNCVDGADEVNCERPSMCPLMHHICPSSITGNFTCLHIDRVNDGIIDCLGASDERQFCRTMCTSVACPSYRCSNSSRCISSTTLWRSRSFCCATKDDEKNFCANAEKLTLLKCLRETTTNRVEDFLCKLDGQQKLPIPLTYLSLTIPKFYYSPSQINLGETSTLETAVTTTTTTTTKKTLENWMLLQQMKHCKQGIAVRRSVGTDDTTEIVCFCPSGYYGRYCEYQNQRVSLTVRIKVSSHWRTVFIIVMTLYDIQQDRIESHEQFYYFPIQDCGKKFNIHLLYTSRPKNISTNYIVHIHVYNNQTLEYHAGWSYPIVFSFLPVNRLPVLLKVPMVRTIEHICDEVTCGSHGHCFQYVNTNSSFCRCDKGWTGIRCHVPYTCHCSQDSRCIGPNICLCPLGKIGARCYLNRSISPCKNNGIYMQNVKHISQENNFYCVCTEGYFGLTCEKNSSRIIISFASDIKIPLSIHVHLITAAGKRTPFNLVSIFKKIPLDQDTVTIFRSNPFNLVFVEIGNRTYYLTVVQQESIVRSVIPSRLTESDRCLSIETLFNASFVKMHVLRRMKYYHLPCKKQKNLACFYDESHMCICNQNLQQANCFAFEHKIVYNCKGQFSCNNNGHCFQENPSCPTEFICICNECSYGSQCQFSTKNFFLSLDIILGHQIRPFVSFDEQRSSIKIILGIVTLMLVFGFISSTLSMLTFQAKKVREMNSGYYLLISSYISIIALIVFAFKFYFLIIFQMGLITNHTFLFFNCKVIDFFLKILLNIVDWINACVAIDRAIISTKDNSASNNKNKRIPKLIISCIFIFTTLSHIQDPINRRLIDDQDEKRIWCILEFSSSIQSLNRTILLIHFLIPFIANIISTLIIIFDVARRRSVLQKQLSYKKHLYQQFYALKHLLIGPLVLTVLALPQIIISFTSQCMGSLRAPWLFLTGYLISFLPPMLIFFVFALPSKTYMDEFSKIIKQIKRKIRSQ